MSPGLPTFTGWPQVIGESVWIAAALYTGSVVFKFLDATMKADAARGGKGNRRRAAFHGSLRFAAALALASIIPSATGVPLAADFLIGIAGLVVIAGLHEWWQSRP